MFMNPCRAAAGATEGPSDASHSHLRANGRHMAVRVTAVTSPSA